MGLCNGKYRGSTRLDGKTAIITGSNTGIGKINAMEFYKRGCRVIMACRSQERGKEALNDILNKSENNLGNGEIVFRKLDLSSLTSVREFAASILETEPRIDLLINNAGVMTCPKSFTEDGYELQFGTNHLGHYLLTMLLLPRILNSTPARIVNLASIAHEYAAPMDWDNFKAEKSYHPITNYKRSKLANVMFTTELARRLEGKGVTVYAVHPGVIKTELHRHMNEAFFPGARWFYNIGMSLAKTPEEGAQTTHYCALDEQVGEQTGLYYADCKKKRMNPEAKKEDQTKKLWEMSAQMVGLEDYDPFTVLDKPPQRSASNKTMETVNTETLIEHL